MLFIAGRPKSPNSKRQTKVNSDNPAVYKCTRCGKIKSDPKGYYFMSKTSPLFVSNDLYTCICSDCANELYEESKIKYKDEKMALIIACHYIDVYFSEELYYQIKDNANFSLGNYLKHVNLTQYKAKNFTTFLTDLVRYGLKSSETLQEEQEDKWSKTDINNKLEVIKIIGYDPFEGYSDLDRRFLFNELVKYFDDDIADDTYKLSQVIQIVNNNNQIRQYDLIISSLNATTDAEKIKQLNLIKKDLVANNDKIAKENEISVKNRSNKDIGKSTLTYLMKDLREKNFTEAETNYYNQLRSEGSQWAATMSMKSIHQNGFFDENDQQEVFEIQRQLINDLQTKLDDALEANRLLKIKINNIVSNGESNAEE